MRRLIRNQPVAVQLDGQPGVIDCAVGNVYAPVAMLAPIVAITPSLQASLTPPGAIGFMLFEDQSMPVGLRGVARAVYGGGAIEFVVIDRVQMKERRDFPRVGMQTRVRAALAASHGAAKSVVETVTADLSLGGALLARCPGLGHGPWTIELFLPDEPIPVCCNAKLAHQTADHVGISFSDIQEVDLVRLAGAVADREQLHWP